MPRAQRSKSKLDSTGLVTILVAIIGLIGTLSVAYLSYRGPLDVKQQEIALSDTEAAIQAFSTDTYLTAQAVNQILPSPTSDIPTPTIEISTPEEERLFGPATGDLVLKESIVSELQSGLAIRDFRTEATFSVPYDSSQGQWDIGFYFRSQHPATLIIVIVSDNSWILRSYDAQLGDFEWKTVQQGKLGNLNLQKDEFNTISLTVFEKIGCLQVNGTFVAQLDLSLEYSGNISAMSGYYASPAKIPGEKTTVKNFSVYSADNIKCP